MSRSDLAKKAEKSAARIAKIEPVNPEIMDYQSVKDELLMRLKDAALIYGANLIFNSAMAFENAQRAVIEADLHEGFKAAEQYIKELPNFENAERTKALWLELIRRKDDPANGALVATEQFVLIGAEVVDEFGMSQGDLERLTQLEFAIDKGRSLIGESLREIRDSQLYKQYGTFEDYCHEKWGFSRSRAYQLMGEAVVVHNLLTSGFEPDELPKNEGQTRALAAVPPEKQAEVWTQAKAEGKPTAAKIKAIASAEKPASVAVPSTPLRELDGEWNPNLWETPRDIAESMAMLINEHETKILEPCAGTGMIARAVIELGVDLYALEILKDRAKKLEDNRYFSMDADFLGFDFGSDRFDVVITNPPFDGGMEILERSLELLNGDGRCLFLLPLAYFSTQDRAKRFAKLNAHIHRVHPIVGRVAYLKNGIAESGRQCEDAVFDIRLGAECTGGVEFIWQ